MLEALDMSKQTEKAVYNDLLKKLQLELVQAQRALIERSSVRQPA